MPLPAHGLKPGLIAATVVTSIIGAILLSAMVYWLIRRIKAQNMELHSKARTSQGSTDQSVRFHEKAGPEVAVEIATSATGTWADRTELGPEMATSELAMNRFSQLTDPKPGHSSQI